MSRTRLQADFFSRMSDPQAMRSMFDHLPGVFFFVKDVEGRMITANAAKLERLGLKQESEIVGKTDDDFFPPDVALAFRQDDQEIIRTGRPVVNRLELWLDEQRELNWFLTTKLPIQGKVGDIIGVMGMSRRHDEPAAQHRVREVAAAVTYLHANMSQSLSAVDLARAIGVSERQLHRKLRETLGTTPHELMLRIRIQSAAEALTHAGDTIADIALNHGFCDQSAFTQQFRKRTGMTPRQFRQRHALV
ncbi:PAS domain S-box-containing protein [Prosthecobacter fusiformis]|uniref:PAS domain S-box-containing protein n=1 Tax=Prosthecobacter fusiformis TaxID=48464 RepID=A0A4R7STZ9_9BACT|nr:AraC family transcriptional regulator [Prosthecobacter fusiformis]TDU81748.1 PAS domain S-box-containing protein [Prosthecobacter fusiformis]